MGRGLVSVDAGSVAPESWVAEALEAHNKLRAKHGSPPLSWCEDCYSQAKLAADEASSQNSLHHSHHDGEGQNAYMAKPAGSPTDAVQSWYAEIKDWDFSASKKKSGVTGHFTQVSHWFCRWIS